MGLITIKTFDNAPEAYLAKAKLGSQNIPAFVFDDEMITLNPLFSNALHGIKLKVDSKYKDKAMGILQEVEQNPIHINEQILHCPKCNSVNIYNGYKSIKSVKDFFSFVVAMFFATYPLSDHNYYHCKDCLHTFKIKKQI